MVVDPRRASLATKADAWLRVRPGADGALALGIAHVMIERGWFDRDFVRDWTNGPLLVRSDTGRLLTERDLSAEGSPKRYAAWDAAAGRPLVYDPGTRRYGSDGAEPALTGAYAIATPSGAVACKTAFQLCVELCRRYVPAAAESITGVPAAQIERCQRQSKSPQAW